jgi:hypothetical protein
MPVLAELAFTVYSGIFCVAIVEAHSFEAETDETLPKPRPILNTIAKTKETVFLFMAATS